MSSARGVQSWEAALIKAMIAAADFTNDQILAYFSTPDRPLSPFRLSEVKQGKLHGSIPAASNAQLKAYTQVYRDKSRARAAFFETNPLHPASLDLLLPIEDGNADTVKVTETDRYEFKESVNWGNKGQYARTIAAFANARGGFLIFGIRDSDRRVVGITKGKVANYESAKLSQFLATAFSPTPRWTKYEGKIAGKNVGVIAVERSTEKPIICLKNESDNLKEGSIYYRYPSETALIKPGELAALINERIRATEIKWSRLFDSVSASGVDNTAVLDVASGLVKGPAGKFLIDESLLDKVKFITEGSLSEVEGAPTLRLIGDLQVSEGVAEGAAQEVHAPVHISDDQVIEAFAAREEVVSPQVYIAHTALSAKKWLPIFYFMRLAGLSDDEAVSLLVSQSGTRENQLATMVARIHEKGLPPGASQPHLAEPTRGQIIAGDLVAPTTTIEWKAFLKAVRTLTDGEVEPDYLMPRLQDCWVYSANDAPLRSQCQYAIAHVDVVWHRQLTG